jgi:hypothetical protein
MLRVELDVEGESTDMGSLAPLWIELMMRAVVPDVFDEYLAGLHKPRQPENGPDTSAVGLAVLRFQRSVRRMWSGKNLAWLAAQAAAGESVGGIIARPSAAYALYPNVHANAQINRLGSGMVQLSLRLNGDWLAGEGVAVQNRLVDALVTIGEQVDSVYGSIGWQFDNYSTILKYGHNHVWDLDPPGPRGLLRGYDWVTIVPKELASKINGRRADAAFTSLVRLGSGAVVARACDDFFDYDLPRAHEVMRAFAPVLPRGVPEYQEQLGVPVPEPPLVCEDPADYLGDEPRR